MCAVCAYCWVFNQLEHVKLSFYSDDWSKLLVWLLRNSPKLRELNIYVDVSLLIYCFSANECSMWRSPESYLSLCSKVIHSFRTMPRLSGRIAALFLNVCRTLSKLSNLKGSREHKKKGISWVFSSKTRLAWSLHRSLTMLHKEVFDSTTNKDENQHCCGTYVTLSRTLQVIDGAEEWEQSVATKLAAP